MKYVFSNFHIDGLLDVDAIIQTEADCTDAVGEDLTNVININLV